MKKTLRYMLAAMLMLCGTTAFAEDIIWSEDWSGYEKDEVPSAKNTNYSEENGGGTTKIYAEVLAGGTAPELLVAKSQGSFTAVVALNGKSGEMTLSYMANYDRLAVTATGATLGEKVKSGNSYSIPVTVAAGTQSITIVFTNTTSSNARLDNIKLYQGTAKKPAGLSWGKASTTLTIGEEVTLVLSNENNLPVTYTSSDETVATISAEGVITLMAAGKTTLTAAFAGNDEYEAQSVSIDVTVKETDETPGPVDEKITVAKALEIIAALEDGKTTAEEYDVEGYIVSTPDFQRNAGGVLYGNVNFDMADTANGTEVLTVFRAQNKDNVPFNEETILNTIKAGDKVVMHGKLQKYVKNGTTTPELTNGYIVSVEAGTSTIVMQPVQESTDGDIFNLQGQRVEKAVKGLYIIGGKKMLVK